MIIERTIPIAQTGDVKRFSLTDLWTAKFTVQNSNTTGAGVFAFVKWIADVSAIPAAIDATNANYELAPGQSREHQPSRNPGDRKECYNLKHWAVDGASGAVLVSYEDEVFNESIT